MPKKSRRGQNIIGGRSYEPPLFSLQLDIMLRGIPFDHERALPVEYKGIGLECGYRLDLLIANAVVLKSNRLKH